MFDNTLEKSAVQDVPLNISGSENATSHES